MKLGTSTAIAALALGLATAAEAQQVLASQPQSFVDFFVKEGFRPELTRDPTGDPMVMFRYEGATEYLLFYDCADHEACRSVQFYAAFPTESPVALETLNTWNSGMEGRFMRAYSLDDGAVRLNMDVATSQDGISERDFRDLLSLWLDRKQVFEQTIGF
ncbi:MAG: YbjN domain-containing protein [Maritimibacter sp.]|nr:YbjN domain-containing protein [Maritimibacter sp.]